MLDITLLASFMFSVFGWGILSARLLYKQDIHGIAYTLTLGLAAMIFAGGVLNSLSLATPFYLKSVYIAGLFLLLSDPFFRSSHLHYYLLAIKRDLQGLATPDGRSSWVLNALPAMLGTAAIVFVAVYIVPTTVFNVYDDFHTYFPRPFRMLQTGTLGGDPFDILGLDSMGGQAFFHGYVVLLSTPEYLNAFDALFCFSLCIFLLLELCKKLDCHWIVRLLCVCVFVFINTQFVNISSVYSGSLFCIAVLFACTLRVLGAEQGAIEPIRTVIPCGIFLACLLVLKLTYVFFAIIFFLVYLLSGMFSADNFRSELKSGLYTMISGLIVIAPWASMYWPNYAKVLNDIISGTQPVASSGHGTQPVMYVLDYLFSSEPLYWGGSYLGYTFIVMTLFAVTMWSGNQMLPGHSAGVRREELRIVFSASCASVGGYFLFALFFDPDTLIRYSSPVLVAMLPAVTILALHSTSGCSHPVSGSTSGRIFRIFLMGALTITLFTFYDVLLKRARQAVDAGHLIAFPVNSMFRRYSEFGVNPTNWDVMEKLQAYTIPGESILAWVSLPFQFDYKRNRILALAEPGLNNPWLDIPYGKSAGEFRDYLERAGARYIIYQFSGPGMRPDADYRMDLHSPFPVYRKLASRSLALGKAILSLKTKNKVVYRDMHTMVIDIDGSSETLQGSEEVSDTNRGDAR